VSYVPADEQLDNALSRFSHRSKAEERPSSFLRWGHCDVLRRAPLARATSK